MLFFSFLYSNKGFTLISIILGQLFPIFLSLISLLIKSIFILGHILIKPSSPFEIILFSLVLII